jgi:uncharacterized LabA/DUF88 family protein
MKTYAFIDASNLFYGGEKSLGWKIDLSGDGDFLPVLKYMRAIGKEMLILARGPRTAREIRQFAGSEFRDFVRLESSLKFEEKAENQEN